MEHTIIIIVISVLLSALFSGMEIAFVSMSKLEISIFASEKTLSSRILTIFFKNPDKFIASMLISNSIAVVVYGYYTGALIMSLIFPEQANNPELPLWIVLCQTIISTILILTFGEFIPKSFFRLFPKENLRLFALPTYIIYKIVDIFQLSNSILWISKIFLTKVLKVKNGENKVISLGKADLGYYIDEQIERLNDKQLEEIDHEIHIFKNALDFGEVKARECMIPRIDMEALDIKSSIDQLRELFVQTGLSKIIIYRESIDNVIGYAHSFELFKNISSIKEAIMPVEFVPETMPVKDVLNTLTKNRISVAIVTDEYGGTAGMLTVEDIIEEILGDIEDEHDSDNLIEEQISDNEFLFSARLEVDYINQEYGLNLPEKEEYETLAGLIISHKESLGEKDDIIELENGVKLIIEQATNNKIELVRLIIDKKS